MQIDVRQYLLPDERITLSSLPLSKLALTPDVLDFARRFRSQQQGAAMLTLSLDADHPAVPGAWWLSRGLIAWCQMLIQRECGLIFVPHDLAGSTFDPKLCLPGSLEAGEVYVLQKSSEQLGHAIAWDCPVGGLPQPFEDRFNLTFSVNAGLSEAIADAVLKHAGASGIEAVRWDG